MTETASETFKQWAVLEIMGHRKLAGIVSEQVIAGQAFIRVDVPKPETDGFSTQFYGTHAVFCITPVDESLARRFAAAHQPVPVQPYELRTLPGHADLPDRLEDEFEDEDDPERAYD